MTTVYPSPKVNDCAGHPADISTDVTNEQWLLLPCEECEVEVADPAPDAFCTDAPENVKRGSANFNTPAPTVLVEGATAAPQSAVISEFFFVCVLLLFFRFFCCFCFLLLYFASFFSFLFLFFL